MKIKWLGHACFVITSEQGVKILTDPYSRDANLTYPEIKDKVDIVTVSHDHFDHNAVSTVPGDPTVLKGSTQMVIKDIGVKTVNTFHDTVKGKERGINHIFCLTVDKINICHLGDLGHRLDPGDMIEMGKVDVLLMPIGGVFTIDVDGANQVYQDIKPRVAIPMHYKTDRCQWLTFSADDFIKGKANAKKLNSSEIELTSDKLPGEKEILVLKYAA
jgi:L-ascorbate metabolism protein UlaG (beta-lactamase superfamily)